MLGVVTGLFVRYAHPFVMYTLIALVALCVGEFGYIQYQQRTIKDDKIKIEQQAQAIATLQTTVNEQNRVAGQVRGELDKLRQVDREAQSRAVQNTRRLTDGNTMRRQREQRADPERSEGLLREQSRQLNCYFNSNNPGC